MPSMGHATLDGASKPMMLGGNLRRACKTFRHKAGMEIRTSEHVKFAEGQVAMLLEVAQDRVVADTNGVCRVITHS